MPGGIRVIRGHRFSKLCGVRTKILFVNRSRSVDNESHHTRRAVLNRVSDEGESCAHLPIDDVFLRSARCMSSLASEDPEHIPIERDMLANLVRREILARVSDERVYRAVGLIAGTLPVQTIMPAFVAYQLLRILFGQICRRTRKILFLCFDQVATRIHGGEFLLTYAPEYALVFASRGVEIPRAVIVH